MEGGDEINIINEKKKQKCNPVQQTLITTTTLIGGQCVQLTSIVRRIRRKGPFFAAALDY